MSTIIKQIVVFNNTGGKRKVKFEVGLNIITGDSKTGKSALIEIIDYCLFSSRSSIPVGKITDFAELFVVIYHVNEFYIVVGRPAPKTGNEKLAYLNIETDYTKIDDIKLDYFDDISLKPIKGDVQNEFEELLGLSLKNLESDYENFGKLSIRDTVSFLFQHQNLIANKHALFYRFDDLVKRKRVIQALPVLLGTADAEYFNLIKQIKELERKISSEEKVLEKIKIKSSDQLLNLREVIQIYYSMLNLTLKDNLKLQELKKIGSDLPMPPETLSDQTKFFNQISKFENERELFFIEKIEIEKAINSLLNNSNESLDYAKSLIQTQSKQKYNKMDSHLNCPLCENEVLEISLNIEKIALSKTKLVEELTKINSFSKDSTQIVERFRGQLKELNYKIKSHTQNINLLSKQNSEIDILKSNREKIIHKKGVIETTIKHIIETSDLSNYNSDLVELNVQLRNFKIKLDKYVELKTFKTTTEAFIKDQMDRIASKLDFEEELKPINFYFDIDNFNFYHKHNSTKIRLDEMGSGANWLACHLSLFISFLHLSCSNTKSIIPSFLIIDQPSQVYFPRTAKKSELLDSEEADKFDDNIEQVRKIFKVLNEEINLIFKNSGIMPQIIVLEHANDPDFKEFIIEDWDKSAGDGLI